MNLDTVLAVSKAALTAIPDPLDEPAPRRRAELQEQLRQARWRHGQLFGIQGRLTGLDKELTALRTERGRWSAVVDTLEADLAAARVEGNVGRVDTLEACLAFILTATCVEPDGDGVRCQTRFSVRTSLVCPVCGSNQRIRWPGDLSPGTPTPVNIGQLYEAAGGDWRQARPLWRLQWRIAELEAQKRGIVEQELEPVLGELELTLDDVE